MPACFSGPAHFNWLSQKLSDTFWNVGSQCNAIPKTGVFMNGTDHHITYVKTHSWQKVGGIWMGKFNKSLLLCNKNTLRPVPFLLSFIRINVYAYQIIDKSNLYEDIRSTFLALFMPRRLWNNIERVPRMFLMTQKKQ